MPETNANPTDPVKEKWKVFAEAACLEKKWTNERLAWLFTPQGVLFAALGITLTNEIDSSLVALRQRLWIGISLLGIVISIVVFLSVLAAAVMHREWTNKMQEIAKEIPDEVAFGNAPHWPSSLARWAPLVLPLFFGGVWISLLMALVCHC